MTPQFEEWLPAARAGSEEAMGRALEACRAYLTLVADRELDPALRAKGGASDIVQETFLDAHRDFRRFQGGSEDELMAWLRRILLNNLANFRRRYRQTDKRAAGREIAIDAGGSSTNWHDAFAADVPTPSIAMQQQEQDQALDLAMARLPADYRDVILWRYRDELPFAEIAQRMNRSSEAVRKLWSRAVEHLQQELECGPLES